MRILVPSSQNVSPSTTQLMRPPPPQMGKSRGATFATRALGAGASSSQLDRLKPGNAPSAMPPTPPPMAKASKNGQPAMVPRRVRLPRRLSVLDIAMPGLLQPGWQHGEQVLSRVQHLWESAIRISAEQPAAQKWPSPLSAPPGPAYIEGARKSYGDKWSS